MRRKDLGGYGLSSLRVLSPWVTGVIALLMYGVVGTSTVQAQVPTFPPIPRPPGGFPHVPSATQPASGSPRVVTSAHRDSINVAQSLAAPGTGLFAGVTLSPAQQAQWLAMLQSMAPRMQAMQVRVRAAERAAHGPADSTTRAAVNALFDEQWAAGMAILTPAQRARVEQNRTVLRQHADAVRSAHPLRGTRP